MHNNGRHPGESVETITDEMQGRMAAAAAQARDELAEMQARMQDLRQELGSRAAALRRRTVSELMAAAARLRREAQTAPDVEAASRAEALADELERQAEDFDRRSLAAMRARLSLPEEPSAQEVLLVALVVGLVIGLLIGVRVKTR